MKSRIGHSYFCNLTADKLTDRALSAIVEYELIPLLKGNPEFDVV